MTMWDRWRILWMDQWGRDAIDLVGPGFIEFHEDGTGEFGFVAVRGWMDWRTTDHDGPDRVEFSWHGDDEGDDVSGRGWARLTADGALEGHLFIHLGDDSAFHAVPFDRAVAPEET